MTNRSPVSPARRHFVRTASMAFGAPWLLQSGPSRAEPPPEVKKIRLIHFPAICLAFGYLAKELLHAEGFEEVEYVDVTVNSTSPYVTSGKVDMWADAAPSLVNGLAGDTRAIALGGIHAGCYELLAHHNIRAIRDLKHRSVAISSFGSTEHIFVASMAAYVGINPKTEIDWKVSGSTEATLNNFVTGAADAFLGFAPQPQFLSDRKVGHVIVNTTEDRPWSQYFCCMVTGNREFVTRNPVATKRALRAFLKAADICADQPDRAARYMVERGYEKDYDLALRIISGLPYRRWRDSNPEDTIRFHALRLHEAGMIQVPPQKLIARGTDWRFFNALKRELRV